MRVPATLPGERRTKSSSTRTAITCREPHRSSRESGQSRTDATTVTDSTDSISGAAQPVPVRVVLPADPVLGHPEQEVVARLWRRRQTETG
jgi:hypothetical protein